MSSYNLYCARVSVADTRNECECYVTILKLVVSAFVRPLLRRRPPSGSGHLSMSRCMPYHSNIFEAVTIQQYNSAWLVYKRHDKWYSQITQHTGGRLPAAIQRWLWMIVKNKNQCHKYPIQFFPLRARNCRISFFFTTPEYGLEHKCAFVVRMVESTNAPLLLHINVNFTSFFFCQTTWIYDEKITSSAYILIPSHLMFSLQINSHWFSSFCVFESRSRWRQTHETHSR